MNNEPVAWMREDGTLKFKEGAFFAVGQPFYTHPAKEYFEGEPQAEELHEILQSNSHSAKTLSKDELGIMWEAAMSRAYKEKDGEAYEFFANAILKKASEK
jgi:hypothetical protein